MNPWLTPVLNRAVRLQKPPLPYWCAAVLFKLFGFGEGWARLVPALLGAISTLMVYDIGRRTLGPRMVREMPPISSLASRMTGVISDRRSNSKPAVSPAGPAPIMIALLHIASPEYTGNRASKAGDASELRRQRDPQR